jgi:hypothetical protein
VHVLDNSIVVSLFHKASERREASIGEQYHIASLALRELDFGSALGQQLFSGSLCHHKVHKGTAMRLSGTAASGTTLGAAGARACVGKSTPKEHKSRQNTHC